MVRPDTTAKPIGENVAGLDLTDDVTVFVSTVGAPSYEACLDHLRRQDCGFRFELIDYVAPLSAAFQQMLDCCTTPFYVQVDEDMLLLPHAVRSLYERIAATDDGVAIYVCLLWDVHLERCITGVKIFRHSIVRQYPLRDVEGCEWDQVRRLQRDSFSMLRLSPESATRTSAETLGYHGTHWTPRAIYERYCGLERTRCKGNRTHDWLFDYPAIFLDRYLCRGDPLDLYALMGLIAGRLANHHEIGREKDYRTYDKLPGHDSIYRYLDEVTNASYEDLIDSDEPGPN
ncbi:MAG: hypothetical protein O7B81_17070 [Gammaproteobacteria bacterium]|nr:hypothetical protein [Gammaproteobacteria bacterium]